MRLAGAAGGMEKLEVLDGEPREIFRTRDEIRCYLPESRTIKVAQRSDARAFPALLPERVSGLAAHYDITLGETRRIAGFDCQAILLSPKDDLRYGYKLWADARSAMLLKAQTVNRRGQTLEQFTFTQLEIGNVARSKLRPPQAAREWRVEQAGAAPADLSQAGWAPSCLDSARSWRFVTCCGTRNPSGRSCFPTDWRQCPCSLSPCPAAPTLRASGLPAWGP
jgi:sigma-E factor negative regulatory protein RseB